MRYVIRPMLTAILVTALLVGLLAVVVEITGDDRWYILVLLLFIVSLEAIYTTNWLHHPRQMALDRNAYRAAELLLLLVIVRVWGDRLIDQKGLPRTPSPAFEVGDASFHSGWTLHSAPPNHTDTMREAMTIIYYADGTRVGALDHPTRRFDRDVWLRGCEPGQLAAGPRNPVLYAREES